MKKFLERLGKELLIFDGGSGTLLQRRGLPAGTRPECWNIDRPDEIIKMHSEYIAAGADIITTNTFGSNSYRFPEGTGYTVEKTIEAALDCAEAARSESGREVYIAMDIGPCGRLVGADISFEEAVSCFSRSVKAGKGRADLFIVETFGSLAETRAAVIAVKENSDLPLIVCNAYEENSRTFSGSGADVMATVISGMGADSVGINCSLGPDEMLAVLPDLLSNTMLPVTVMPNAGLPKTDEFGNVLYDISPQHFAACAVKMVKMGASVIGGCCGTTPEYIRLVKKALAGRYPVKRNISEIPFASSETSTCRWSEGFCVIGERINPTGKPRFREALKNGDLDYCVNEAHSQVSAGARIIDVNVGIPEINEVEVLRESVGRIQQVSKQPLQIDTSNIEAMEAALRVYNGKAVINSTNGSEKSMTAVFPLASKYGGTIVGLTLDENGIPDSPEGRLQIAERIVSRARDYGIGKERIIIDPLTLTLGSDPLAAEKTLKAVSLIKNKLGVRCSLGVSNISFGLPDRERINCEFLAAAIKEGLDAAIMNPNSAAMMKVAIGQSSYGDAEYLKSAGTAKTGSDDGTLSGCILSGMKDRATQRAAEMCKSADPQIVISSEVVPALDKAGEQFENGIMFLPGLLACAEAAISALSVITSFIEKDGKHAALSGKVVMATVEGDVHDIGKNIVCVMLRSYGFDVIDLGKNVPPQTIVDAVIASGAKVCGLSALMTTTLPSMRKTVELLHEKCPDVKTVCGGAVLTREYCQKIGADCYAPDASATVRFASAVYKNN